MDDIKLPPTPPPPPPPVGPEQPKSENNVIELFSRKKPEDLGVIPFTPPGAPPPPPGQVVRLTPKQVAEIQALIEQAKSIWMRRASCAFERSHNPKGCGCNYCVYINMMSKRVFDMVQGDIIYQMRRGKMVFCAPDMIEILQLAVERVMQFENEQTQGPPTK